VPQSVIADGRVFRRSVARRRGMQRTIDRYLDLQPHASARAALGYLPGQVMRPSNTRTRQLRQRPLRGVKAGGGPERRPGRRPPAHGGGRGASDQACATTLPMPMLSIVNESVCGRERAAITAFTASSDSNTIIEIPLFGGSSTQ
jgi:hypothetical protein